MSFRENIGPDGPTPKKEMTYRTLKAGEFIHEGDEWSHHYGKGSGETWEPVKTSVGMFVSKDSIIRYRRPYEPDMCLNEGYDDDIGYGTEFFGGTEEYEPVKSAGTDHKPTKKHKRQWYTVPLSLFSPVIDVFADANKKYGRCSWMHCDASECIERYYSPMLRHIEAFTNNEWLDPKSGQPHLAHAVANALILLWHGIKHKEVREYYDQA